MGITGLLPFVKKASAKCHVRKFSGCTVAIDAYCWLHKESSQTFLCLVNALRAFGCAEKLGKGEPTTAYITYCLKYINVLLSHNIKPILVLDGRNLISKSHTEKQRRQKRDENKKNAKEFLRKGMKKQAWECFTRCIDITPAMAREFIKTLRDMKLDYIVAPYEADAQLAYLARKNIVDIVITEDSDLILFGCPKIFFKMSVLGDGVLFDQSKIPTCMGMKVEQFQFERFRWMAILSGCDYLPSLPGIGLARAKKIITGTTSNDLKKMLPQIPNLLGNDFEVTEEYIEGFIRAENTFLYQLIFDPINRRLIPLTPYPADIDRTALNYAGFYEEKKLALDMALGNVDIHTLKKVDNFDPMKSNTGYNDTSMWSPDFKISTIPRMITARDMKKGTQHSSTIGMQANVSVGASLKKRPLLDPTFQADKNTSNDEELLSMYCVKDEPTLTKVKQEIPCSPNYSLKEQSTKRVRLEEKNSTGDENDFKEEVTLCKKRNPFLKSQSKDRESLTETVSYKKRINIIVGSNSINNPLCVIEKNKIYDGDNVIVKSQYFRNKEGNDRKRPRIKLELETDKNRSNFRIKVETSEEEEEPEEQDLKSKVENSENVESSQMSIYSIGRYETENLGSQDGSISSFSSQNSTAANCDDDDVKHAQVFTVDNNDDEEEIYSPSDSCNEIKLRLRSSPAKKSGSSNGNSKSSRSKGLLGPCRRVGLSRNGFKNKVDPKQKTLSSMFAMQQKPKL